VPLAVFLTPFVFLIFPRALVIAAFKVGSVDVATIRCFDSGTTEPPKTGTNGPFESVVFDRADTSSGFAFPPPNSPASRDVVDEQPDATRATTNAPETTLRNFLDTGTPRLVIDLPDSCTCKQR